MTSNNELASARKPLEQYIEGHRTRQADVMRAAFLPSARVEGMRAEGFSSWDIDTYCGFFDGVPSVDEPQRVRTIESIDVYETVAMAGMTLIHGATKFTDMFVLLKQGNGEWKIANKAYHAEPSNEPHSQSQQNLAAPDSVVSINRPAVTEQAQRVTTPPAPRRVWQPLAEPLK
jgi:Putative lumazine-binding